MPKCVWDDKYNLSSNPDIFIWFLVIDDPSSTAAGNI